MPKKPVRTQKQLLAENEDLRARLDEAEQTLRSIRSSEVDTLIVSGAAGEQVFTLKGADHPYRVLIENMSEGALTLTMDGVILYANHRFAEMLKTPLEKVIGSTIHTWTSPDSQRILQSLLRKSVDNNRREQLVLIASDRTLVQVSLSVSDSLIKEMPDALCMVATDLTEQKRNDAIIASEKMARELLAASDQSRLAMLSMVEDLKQAEEALRESERGLKEAQSLGRLGNWGYDFENQTITWSDEVYQLYGRDPVLGPPTPEEEAAYYSPEQAQILREYSSRAFKEGKSFEYDLEVNLPSGNHLFFSAKIKPVKDATSRVVKLFGTIQDVTERKRTEEELKKSEGKFRAIFDNASDGMFVIDLKTRKFFICNTSCVKMLGYAQDEFLNLDIADIHPGEDLPFIYEQIGKFSRGEEGIRSDITFKRKNGSIFASDLNPALLTIGEKGYLLISFRDITEIKQSQEALARQAEELRLRNAELDRLYRATGSLLSSTPFDEQALAKSVVEVVLQDFGQANCGVFLIRKDSNELDWLAAAGPYADQVKKVVLTVDGAGLIAKAVRSGQVINTPDVRADPVYLVGWEAARSELTIPLKVGDHVIGAIDVQSTEPGAFKPDDERLLSIFAERAAQALERGRLNEELERRLQQLTSLRTIDMAISSSLDMNLTLGILLDQLTKHLAVDAADVLLFDPRLQTFKYAAEQGFRTQGRLNSTLRAGDRIASRVLSERQIIVIQNLASHLAELHRSDKSSSEGFDTYVGTPLIAKGQVKGVLEIFQRSPFELNPEQRTFLEMLAGQAAIAIDSAQLFENLQDSNFELMMAYDETIEGWSRAMDLRDKETEGHTQRVTELTLRLAASMGLGAEEQAHLRRGALLHDIGKMGVPDDILRKPGALTEEEWVIMRRHPQLAYDMLVPIIYLRPSIDIPYCHHEKWDGTGYPRGLKDVQIPLGARIFAVVDVWDALSSDRPYRKAWPEDKVRQYIREQAGKHFDPHVVENFLKMVLNVE